LLRYALHHRWTDCTHIVCEHLKPLRPTTSDYQQPLSNHAAHAIG
jgi:hypothetical protein